MGSSQTKEKSNNIIITSPSEKVVQGLEKKVSILGGEIDEMMRVREAERQIYELMIFAYKQAADQWKRERKRLEEEVKRLTVDHSNNRDETVEKWKQLYFAVKLELDHLIQRTQQEERMWLKPAEEEGELMEINKKDMKDKEEIIEILQKKIANMEQQESKKERAMDILRQSLRIMSHNNRPPMMRGHLSNHEN